MPNGDHAGSGPNAAGAGPSSSSTATEGPAAPGPTTGVAADDRPIPNCYWVEPGRLLAGEYPGATTPAEARRKLALFLDAGVDVFIDLTEPGELVPYEALLQEHAVSGGRRVDYHRHPILDVSVPGRRSVMAAILDRIDGALAAGRMVYVHCWGGTGRTGTVVGCFLVRHGLSGEAALSRTLDLWRKMEKAPRRAGSPETHRQREFVRQWREPRRNATHGGRPFETALVASPKAAAVAAAVAAVRLGATQTWRGLSVVPLLARAPRQARSYLTLAEALDAGSFRITEASGGATVSLLRAVNDGDEPVLLLIGEELVGAKQNRIVNVTLMIPARAELAIPVSCVEQGRWRMRGPHFRASGRAIFAQARARAMRDVTRSLATRGARHSDQSAVWEDVRGQLDRLGARSPTGAMSAAFEAHAPRIEEYVGAFDAPADQVGALFAMDGRVVGLELFDSPAAFRGYQAELLRSYALDVIAAGAVQSDRGPGVGEAERALVAVVACSVAAHPAVGLGEDLRLDDGTLTGAALAVDGALVHLAAFWTETDGGHEVAASPSAPTDNRGTLRTLLAQRHIAIEPSTFLDRDPAPLEGADIWDRVEGMLLGLAIGDSLGNSTEGRNPADRLARVGEIKDYLPNRYVGGRAVGVPSDDTQLAFWTLRRLIADRGLVPESLAREFCRHRIFGIGSTVRAFTRRFRGERRSWQEAGTDSAGNGALMRIAPVLLPHVRRPSAGLWADAALATMITHNDRVAVASSVAFIDLLWRLLGRRTAPEPEWYVSTFCASMRELEGETHYCTRTPHVSYEGPVWRFTDAQVRQALAARLTVREACERWDSGAYLLETVPSLIYILSRHGHDPEEAIVRAVNDTRDNDSIGAMVGAAVGALHGRRALPRRWVAGLLGRTGEADDGEVFRIMADARALWERGTA